MTSIAIIVVDVQNDFLEGGALAVPDANAVVPVIRDMLAEMPGAVRVLSQDYHPPNHCSFYTNNPGAELFSVIDLPSGSKQMMWPPHCVMNTHGAKISRAFDEISMDVLVQKGGDPKRDSYSAFSTDASCNLQGEDRIALADELRSQEVGTVVCCGLALDYCVSYTARDAAAAGFKTYVVLDACRGVSSVTVETEIEKMVAAGVIIVNSWIDLPNSVLQRTAGLKTTVPIDPEVCPRASGGCGNRNPTWSCGCQTDEDGRLFQPVVCSSGCGNRDSTWSCDCSTTAH